MDELCKNLKYHDYDFNAVNMAGWADEVKHDRDKDDEYREHFNNWHFIDLGLNDGDPNPLTSPPTLSVRNGSVVEAIQLCIDVIKDHKQSNLVPDESVALALLIHFVGDIHQPLHCATNYLDQGTGGHKPKTDIGGNAVAVDNFTDQYEELHQFWDEAYKMSFDKDTQVAQVESGWSWSKSPGEITPTNKHLISVVQEVMRYKPSGAVTVDLSDTTFLSKWAKETNGKGREIAYGKLQQDYTNHSVRVTAEYTAIARETAQQQMCLAGLRLAALLKELYP